MFKYKCASCGEEQRLWFEFGYRAVAYCDNDRCYDSDRPTVHVRAIDWKIAEMTNDDYK